MLESKAAVGVEGTVPRRSPVWPMPRHRTHIPNLEATAVMGAHLLRMFLLLSPGLVGKMIIMAGALAVAKVHLDTDLAVHDESFSA